MKALLITLLLVGLLWNDNALAGSKEVTLLKSVQAPIMVDGRQVGSVQLPAGATLTLVLQEEGGVVVTRGGGEPFTLPKEVFALSELAAASPPPPERLDVARKTLPPLSTASPSPSPSPAQDAPEAVKSRMEAAIARVKEIVNQPVRKLRRTPDMWVSTYSPGWFHEGAIKPDFNTVDIRATQKLDYDSGPNHPKYVTSDINPGFVFIGADLEFNAMTKYFYTDRSLPKKKLSENDMFEINKLYRIIGECERQLVQ